MKLTFDNATLEILLTGKSYRVTLGDKTAEADILHADAERGQIEFLLGGERLTAYVSSDHTKRWVTVNGQTFVLTRQSGSRKRGGGHLHTAGELTAPMPGQIRAVNVSEGETVTKGQTLIILEAMKMEIRIQAPMDGTVSKLLVKQGQTVEREQKLIEIVDKVER
ncbi:MAG: biotin/lipoyl-binding protein [Chloroflexi bacterium]|nr:biotin/lipoyl-binding protein [Chloroflexota bacterium]